MTNIRRYYSSGKIYFLTHVTYLRKPILIENIDLFWRAIETIKTDTPFDLIAWVILPDHFHILIDPKETNLSNLMRRIKLSFSNRYRKKKGITRGRTWQNRFWDHVIRDEVDMNRHLDYIHHNPVKHGHIVAPTKWEHSSFRKYAKNSYYSDDWGQLDSFKFEGEYGE